jgi:hypothetical protein
MDPLAFLLRHTFLPVTHRFVVWFRGSLKQQIVLVARILAF